MASLSSEEVSSKPYREVTVASIVLGTVVGIALTVSFTYAGLKLGFTVPASMVGAMLGLGVLRVVMKRGSIVENNINQTVAAAVNVSAAGVIFTVPVLYLMQAEAASKSADIAQKAAAAGLAVDDFLKKNPGMVQLLDTKMILAIAGASVAGALLGVFFIVPSRKQMIELERLVFPSGVATATILKATGAGPTRFRWLVTGIGISIVFALLTSLGTLFPHWHAPTWYERYSENLDLGGLLGIPAHLAVVVAVAGGLTSLGGGYITGKAGLIMMVGAIVGHWIVTPIVVTKGWMPPEIAESLTTRATKAAAAPEAHQTFQQIRDTLAATWAYKQITRPLGIGMLLGGSIASVILTAPMLVSAIKSIQKARSVASSGTGAAGAQELSPKLLWVGIVVSFVMLSVSGWLGSDGISLPRILLAAGLATIWMWLANIIVSIATGKTDNSPLSGMALLTIVLIVSVLGREGATVALLMAVSVCVATGQGSDMMQDLKTGHLVGAIPRRQQITQLAVSWIGPLVSLATLVILSKKFIFGNDPLTAPQGQAIKAALEVFVPPPGTDDLTKSIAATIPWRYAAGTVTGLLLTLGGGGGLGVVLGLAMYLPMAVTLTYCTGCAICWVTEKIKGPAWVEDVGVPLAAGFLVGEGLAQVGVVFFDLTRSALALAEKRDASRAVEMDDVRGPRFRHGVGRDVAVADLADGRCRSGGHRGRNRDEAQGRRARDGRAQRGDRREAGAHRHVARGHRRRCRRDRGAGERGRDGRFRAREEASRRDHLARPRAPRSVARGDRRSPRLPGVRRGHGAARHHRAPALPRVERRVRRAPSRDDRLAAGRHPARPRSRRAGEGEARSVAAALHRDRFGIGDGVRRRDSATAFGFGDGVRRRDSATAFGFGDGVRRRLADYVRGAAVHDRGAAVHDRGAAVHDRGAAGYNRGSRRPPPSAGRAQEVWRQQLRALSFPPA